jgi:hypothetical protein
MSTDAFTQFYMGKHNGRKLNWEGQYSKVDVRTSGFGDRGYEINMGLHAYAVLDCAFNAGSGIGNVGDVVFGCGLEKSEVERIVKV